MRIEVIDSGICNLGAVMNIFRRLGYSPVSLSIPEQSSRSDLIVLPGVGSFDAGVTALRKVGWFDFLKDYDNEGAGHILGICLGMQLLCEGSDEGVLDGLGLVPGRFVKINGKESGQKVPNMGWRKLSLRIEDENWFSDMDMQSRFYFVHSYYYTCETDQYILACSESIPAIVQKDRVTGFQFHPEKSHRFGVEVLRKYVSRLNAS